MESLQTHALSIDEVARRLNVHRRTVVRMLDAGELPSLHVRRRRVVPAAALDALLAQPSLEHEEPLGEA